MIKNNIITVGPTDYYSEHNSPTCVHDRGCIPFHRACGHDCDRGYIPFHRACGHGHVRDRVRVLQ